MFSRVITNLVVVFRATKKGGSLRSAGRLYGITGTRQDQLCHFGILDLLRQIP